ncbi:hypothetical protein [Streptomyces sp. NBC_01438]|uniref:hypothetical protein n=1 Tax=Streptomyces sp. NBC_01438 TaxID=2903866 RepID=UPI00324D4C7D
MSDAERVLRHPRRRLSGVPGVGLIAEVLGLVQERELVGHRSESGCRLAGRSHGGGEAGDDPRTLCLLVLVGDTEEDFVAQTAYQ